MEVDCLSDGRFLYCIDCIIEASEIKTSVVVIRGGLWGGVTLAACDRHLSLMVDVPQDLSAGVNWNTHCSRDRDIVLPLKV